MHSLNDPHACVCSLLLLVCYTYLNKYIMKAYQDSEEIPDRSQELYCTLCQYIRKHLVNTTNTLCYLKW